jgi:hypothetical protein
MNKPGWLRRDQKRFEDTGFSYEGYTTASREDSSLISNEDSHFGLIVGHVPEKAFDKSHKGLQ